MTAKEIISKIDELDIDGYTFADDYEFPEEGFGESKIVDSEGDYEGGGEYAMVVRHFKEHDVYIKNEGFYSSYNGTDWEGNYQEVKPIEKIIIQYQ